MKPYQRGLLIGPVMFLACVSLYIGLGAETIITMSRHIVAEMMDTSLYVNAVLGLGEN